MVKLFLTGLQGRKKIMQKDKYLPGKYRISCYVPELDIGMYILGVRSKNGILTQKVIKSSDPGNVSGGYYVEDYAGHKPGNKIFSINSQYQFTAYAKGFENVVMDSVVVEDGKNYKFLFRKSISEFDYKQAYITIDNITIEKYFRERSRTEEETDKTDTINFCENHLLHDSIYNRSDFRELDCMDCRYFYSTDTTIGICYESYSVKSGRPYREDFCFETNN